MKQSSARALVFGLFLWTLGCDRAPKEPTPPAKSAPAAKASEPAAMPLPWPEKLVRAAPERLVAIGDLHGDLAAARKAFQIAGACDAQGKWIGGKLVVVQTGDTVDRGDDDRAMLDWLMRLREEAKAAGGELILLLGNHELMNVQGDFRYVTPASFSSFGGGLVSADGLPVPQEQAGRFLAFRPGGSYAKKLAEQHLLLVKVGRSVFVHGGISPQSAKFGVEKLNDAAISWLRGELPKPPESVLGERGPVWLRDYSQDPGPAECKDLQRALALLDADRMVMGHTVQRTGIDSVCDGKAWRIDVGMARFYGGKPQALELRGSEARVLRE